MMLPSFSLATTHFINWESSSNSPFHISSLARARTLSANVERMVLMFSPAALNSFSPNCDHSTGLPLLSHLETKRREAYFSTAFAVEEISFESLVFALTTRPNCESSSNIPFSYSSGFFVYVSMIALPKVVSITLMFEDAFVKSLADIER